MECLQQRLEQRWIRTERAKGQIGDWKKMRQQGAAEFVSLKNFLQAAEAARRTDLARFVLRTNAAILQSDMTPVFWTGGLQGSGPPRLADRLETQRSALALPRQMETLEAWQDRARYVGYFDEDYQASQMWKADWEAASGDRVAAAPGPQSRCSNHSADQLPVSRCQEAGNPQARTPKVAQGKQRSEDRSQRTVKNNSLPDFRLLLCVFLNSDFCPLISGAKL